jgi:hypothetical protein
MNTGGNIKHFINLKSNSAWKGNLLIKIELRGQSIFFHSPFEAFKF